MTTATNNQQEKKVMTAEEVQALIARNNAALAETITTSVNTKVEAVKSALENTVVATRRNNEPEEDEFDAAIKEADIDEDQAKLLKKVINAAAAKKDKEWEKRLNERDKKIKEETIGTISAQKRNEEATESILARYPDIADENSELMQEAKKIYKNRTVDSQEAKELAIMKAAERLGIKPRDLSQRGVAAENLPLGQGGSAGGKDLSAEDLKWAKSAARAVAKTPEEQARLEQSYLAKLKARKGK